MGGQVQFLWAWEQSMPTKGQRQVIYLEQMFTFDLQVNNDIGSNYRNKYKTFIDNVMGGQ